MSVIIKSVSEMLHKISKSQQFFFPRRLPLLPILLTDSKDWNILLLFMRTSFRFSFTQVNSYFVVQKKNGGEKNLMCKNV